LLTEAQRYGVRKVISKAAGGELVANVNELLSAQPAEEAVNVPLPALILPPDQLHPPPVLVEPAIAPDPEPASLAVDVPPDVPKASSS